jgi:CHAD domain-containing protein
MDIDELERYFRKRIYSVIREYSTPPSERTEETFHRLRVEIKKIKALYHLIDFVNKKFPRKKLLKPFKEVFDNAGKVRNLQVEENIIKSFSLKNHLISTLHKKQSKATHKFEEIRDKNLSIQIDKSAEEAERFLKDIQLSELRRYNKKVLSKIKNLIKASFVEKDLHKIRMKLKEFYYNLKLTNARSNRLVKNLNRLLELIGSWHDYYFVIIRLDELISKGKLNEKETMVLQAIRGNAVLKKRVLLNKINKNRLRLKYVIQGSYGKQISKSVKRRILTKVRVENMS